LPRENRCPLRFIQQVSRKEKKIMKQTQVVQAYIPNWPELGVRKMWPQAMQIPEFGLYMPDDWTSTEKTERRYFYGILCTLAPDFVEDSISGARLDRENYHRLREQPEE